MNLFRIVLVLVAFLISMSAHADSNLSIQKTGLTGDDDSYYLINLACAGSAEKEHCEVSLKNDQKFAQKKVALETAHSVFEKFESDIKHLKTKKAKGESAVSWSLQDKNLKQNGSVASTKEKQAIDALDVRLNDLLK